MRRYDKIKHMRQANLLAEQRYLEQASFSDSYGYPYEDGLKRFWPEALDPEEIGQMGYDTVRKFRDAQKKIGGDMDDTFYVTIEPDREQMKAQLLGMLLDLNYPHIMFADNWIADGQPEYIDIVMWTPKKNPDWQQQHQMTEMGKNTTDTQSYFEGLVPALEYAEAQANARGYEFDQEDLFNKFGTGGVPYGTTKSYNIQLLKNGEIPTDKRGKPLDRFWHISIYRMESGKYELVSYPTF